MLLSPNSSSQPYPTQPHLLDSFEYFFSPLANPDGYEYSHTTDRYWRKNRGSSGLGVDLNRNWPYYWGYEWGSSSSPWSETYRGPKALSEPETRAIHAYVMSLPRRFVMVDFHSYGQLLLRVGLPFASWFSRSITHTFFKQNWGTNTLTPSSNDALNSKLSVAISNRIASSTGAYYISQTGMDLYPTSGSMDDWSASVGCVSFTIELRDEGDGGFELPASAIVPTGEDGWAALRALVEFARSEEGARLGPQGSVPNDGVYIKTGRARTQVVPLPVKKTTKRKTTTTRRKMTTTLRRKRD
jgi:hypothetical protein